MRLYSAAEVFVFFLVDGADCVSIADGRRVKRYHAGNQSKPNHFSSEERFCGGGGCAAHRSDEVLAQAPMQPVCHNIDFEIITQTA